VSLTVSRRARSREDRAGDPLDGLVNLFDIGIVLAVGFLLAVLSSLNLESALTSAQRAQAARQQSAPPVVARRDQSVRPLRPRPGERVVGRGTPVGTVYRLIDGRTVLVHER